MSLDYNICVPHMRVTDGVIVKNINVYTYIQYIMVNYGEQASDIWAVTTYTFNNVLHVVPMCTSSTFLPNFVCITWAHSG